MNQLWIKFKKWLTTTRLPKGQVWCDLCSDHCKPNGYHDRRSITYKMNWYEGNFHRLHLVRKSLGKPIIQGNYRELEAKRKRRELKKLEMEKEQALLEDYNEIMSVPLSVNLDECLLKE